MHVCVCGYPAWSNRQYNSDHQGSTASESDPSHGILAGGHLTINAGKIIQGDIPGYLDLK